MRIAAALPRCALPLLVVTFAVCGAAQTTSFSNQTVSAGVAVLHSPAYAYGFAAGGAVGDFDRDGFPDIFFATGGGSPDRLFINNGDGTFTDRAAAWGIAVTHRGSGATVGDFDGDGWLDLFVTSFGPVAGEAAGHHKLYRNDAGHGFTDVAPAMGVHSTGSVDGWGGAFGDYDMDGDLDLAVCGWLRGSSNRLFRNDGNVFVDVTVSSGISAGLAGISGFAPKFADMDGDLDPELIWIGDFGTSKYFVNNGNGTFTDFTAQSGTAHDGTEMGVTITDIDEDGQLDFYVTTIATNNLYINQGGNSFTNQATAAGVEFSGWGWGTVAFDMNHDTRVDLLATSQSGQQFAFRNVSTSPQTPRFQEVGRSIGIASTVSGRGLSNFDYDNDGDQDFVIFPSNGQLQLYRNDLSGPDTHWLRVYLDRGCAPLIPADGVGAIVRATVGARTWTRLVEAGSNYLSNSELSAHFGLGAATVVDTLRVEWPDGQVTTLTNVPVDQTLTVIAPSTVACSTPIGAGCPGANGVPQIAPQSGSVPALGTTFALDVTGLDPGGAAAALLLAFDRAAPAVPLDLIGLPGCHLHVGAAALQSVALTNTNGAATYAIPISTDPVLSGLRFYMQGVAIDPGAPHALQLAATGGLRALVF